VAHFLWLTVYSPILNTGVDAGADAGFRQSATQVTLIINPAVVGHYFQPGLLLPSQPHNIIALRPASNSIA